MCVSVVKIQYVQQDLLASTLPFFVIMWLLRVYNMSPSCPFSPPLFLMYMCLPYGTSDCTLSAPSGVWILGN